MSADGGGRPVSVRSHEQRTPVNHILGCSELLLEEAAEHGLEDLAPELQAIHSAGQEVAALVDRLARAEASAQGHAATTASLRVCLADIGERCARLVEETTSRGKEEALADLRAIEAAAQRLLELIGEEDSPPPQPSPSRGKGAVAHSAARGAGVSASPSTAEERPHPNPLPEGEGAASPAPQASVLSPQPSILVVDDSQVNRDLLARRLERLGYRVIPAENGARALAVLQDADVDLELLDILMPEMDGYAVLERRRADPRLRDIPFIVISSLDEVDSVVRCIEMGAEDYLTKPFDPVLLSARIEACLEKKRLRDQEKQHVATIQVQSAELAELNRTLEARVAQQVDDIVRLRRLQRFLSPQIAEVIISSGGERALEPHRREITVAFCDLRGFTAFSETAEPEDVMAVLREYHTAMGEMIFRFDGTLEHFAGDGMMIFFNDPVPADDPAGQAVRMGLAMRERAAELAVAWRKRGHQLAFGMGIAMGYATLGRIGFEGRFDYGAIGSVTNLAARLCDEAAAGQILVSERVCGCVEDAAEIEPIGDLQLRGFLRPIAAFNIVGLSKE